MSGYVDIFEKDYMESRSEVKRSLVYTSISLTLLFLLLIFTHFNILPAIPEDVPPLKSDEVIELFELDVALIPEESGSRGGGTSSQGPIDQPQDQTERVATSHSSDFSSTNGRSNNHNTNNSNNPTSSTHQSTNYFGSGGNGGNGGPGNGPFGGSGNDGDHQESNPPKINRVRINNPPLPPFDIDNNKNKIGLKITINDNGDIIDCQNVRSITTCNIQSIINEVIRITKSKVKYSKAKGVPLDVVWLTVTLTPK